MTYIEKYLRDNFIAKYFASAACEKTATELIDLLSTPEFASLYAKRLEWISDFRWGIGSREIWFPAFGQLLMSLEKIREQCDITDRLLSYERNHTADAGSGDKTQS